MENELEGLVFDIQGYSVHDGPGCRTLIFMKGCPLHCEWCSNPEGMRTMQDVMFRNTKCVNRKNGCTRCIDACPHHAITENPEEGEGVQQLFIDRSLCSRCEGHECMAVCYFEGLRFCGEWRTVDDLMHVLERNRHYWGTRGGVSFSGGEPLLQHEFMHAMLQACRDARIHIAVETTAQIQPDRFLQLMSLVDFAFIDVKHMDSQLHRQKTGVNNDLILQNIEALVGSDWRGRLVLRIPVIENYNDTDENIEAVAAFMQRLGLFEINILPFHRLGDTKWTQLGKEYQFRDKISTPEEKLFHIQDIFLSKHIACYVGSDTPF
ncbi:MAG: 4-hydroxyphenylacetate decarboxylase activase [Chloroflexi bacterium]|jgi:pyruvate formate lyase activating enzyme|nr:4-hydroxyphenylacetate decarboxylase activase [Anaerolineaceae bacterium]NMB90269.1 4-hydroxyphenylacetate decarboxylase activase [Chloroflexota bacterium]